MDSLSINMWNKELPKRNRMFVSINILKNTWLAIILLSTPHYFLTAIIDTLQYIINSKIHFHSKIPQKKKISWRKKKFVKWIKKKNFFGAKKTFLGARNFLSTHNFFFFVSKKVFLASRKCLLSIHNANNLLGQIKFICGKKSFFSMSVWK